MDKTTRNQIRTSTQAARQLLETEFARQLEADFDILPDGTIALTAGTHLDAAQRIVRRKIVAAIEHETAGGLSVLDAVAAYVRETSFTCLNRFVALKMLEARGLTLECISKGEQSAGFKEFCGLAPGLADLPDKGYRLYIECLFDELSAQIRVLFDRQSPASLLWPRKQVLDGLMAIFNHDALKEVWAADETIGWVYQYFNSSEERKKMREASAAPSNSRELAVRNQFFTPRYVVEFLTDNTLGRIWYEIRKADTDLATSCRYLVRRPNEIFLPPGEDPPDEPVPETDLSQEELLKRPVHITHRPKKDPRDLRVLDPACGSGHFLLYAFELLERIYEEAWADPDGPRPETTGQTLQADYPTRDALHQALPKLIVEHNLHGIDIDHRAVQIAALAIWLRAQKSWQSYGLKAGERPTIARSNIVTAEPMPGDAEMLREFTDGLRPRVLGQLVHVVFEKMELAGEAGSLLKIEEEIQSAIAEARRQWAEKPKPEQQTLFPEFANPRPKQLELKFDVKEITDKRFWGIAEGRVLEELKKYAGKDQNGWAVRRRLFSEDAARGFAFIDLCRKCYDVVLMNPPFGEASKAAVNYISTNWPQEKGDLGCCFVSNGLRVTTLGGRLGVLMTRTPYFLSSFTKWRESVVLDSGGLSLFVDLGLGVLEAMVETCACVYAPSSSGL